MEIQLPARAVRRLVKRGELAAKKIGRRWYAEPSALRALLPSSKRSELPAGAAANDAEPPAEDAAGSLLDQLLDEHGLELGALRSRAAGERRSR